MQTRTRARDMRLGFTGHYWSLNTGTVYGTRLCGIREECADTVGNFKGDNYFSLDRRVTYVPTLTGRHVDPQSGVLLTEFADYPVDWQVDPLNPRLIYPAFTAGEILDLTWNLQAKTNPSAPTVSVPTFIGELKDIPSLTRDWGRNLLTKVASGYLTWRWVVKPFMRDAEAMFDFYNAVNVQLRRLQQLGKSGSIRRRVLLDKRETRTTVDVPVQSNLTWIVAARNTTYTDKVWGTCRWKLTDPSAIPKDILGQYKLAKRLFYGVTGYESLSTAWELLPWSWLVDWFFNVGNLISSMNNTLPCVPGGMCLMRTRSSLSEYVVKTKPDWVRINGTWFESWVTEGRLPVVLSDLRASQPALPILTDRQWSILAALSVVKNKRSFGRLGH